MNFRWLKRCADWLDNRFPAKVHVTDKIFQDLLNRETYNQMHMNTMSSEIAALKDGQRAHRKSLEELWKASHRADILSDRVDAIQETIGMIKEVVTKASNPDAQAAARRAAFIESGRMPE